MSLWSAIVRLPRWVRPALACAAGASLYAGERIATASALRSGLSIPGALLLVLSAVWTGCIAWQIRRTSLRSPWLWALAPQAAFLLSGLAYAAVLWIGTGPLAAAWGGPLRFTWALMLAMGTVLFGFVELALWQMGAAAAPADQVAMRAVVDPVASRSLPDAARVSRAAASGLWLALLLGLLATLAVAGQRLAWQWDLTYFRTTEPSEATRAAIRALPEPVQVGLFFPDLNAVASHLNAYLREVTRGAASLSYEALDADLAPQQAQAFQARGNGWVILKRGEQLKPLQIPLKLELARAALRRFDSDFLAALAEVSREPRVVYETVGHGERIELNRPNAAPDFTDRFSQFDGVLRSRNFKVQQIDYAKGLGSRFPDDAFLVVIAGPTEPFSRAEAEALRGYLKRGGRLMAFLEPGEPTARPGGIPRPSRTADPLLAVLAEYGLRFDPVPRANDRIYALRTRTPADFGLLVVAAYEPHPVVAPLRASPAQFPLVLLGAGALKVDAAPAGLKAQATVKTMPGTWGDKNGNFRFDPPAETREDAVLAAVVGPDPALPADNRPAGPYIAAFADADLASDLLIQNRANAILISAGLDWLSGQEPAGAPNLEEDLRIQHMRGDEWLWFYLPVVAIPALLLGLGVWRLTRKRAAEGATAGPTGRAA